MEQARPDSTLLPAAQIEAEHGSPDRDQRIAQLLTARPTIPLPEPGSAEAKAVFKAACHEHTIRTQFTNEYAELQRTAIEWWTASSLSKALETGEVTPAECARLYPLATERELRMAQIEHELNLGGLHALAFAEHYPVAADEAEPDTGDEVPGIDADLLRLGRQFDAASAREMAANEACNAAQEEADRHMPERPACLIYRAADESLRVHEYVVMPGVLEGQEIGHQDVEWLRRKMPMMQDVLRPVRDGESASIDHPGRRRDTVPYPKAQARAEEIVAAWDSWQAERLRVLSEHCPDALEDAANDAGDLAADLAHRIAGLPAQTAAGLRVKLRALAHYNSSFFYLTLPELPDPDQALSHSLWRDVQAESGDKGSSVPNGLGTETDPVPAAVDLGPDRAIAELADNFCRVYRRHGEIDRAMLNGDITEDEWLPHHEAVMALARQLAETKPTTMVGMALKCLGPIGLLAWDGSVTDIPAQLSPHERVAAEFQAANRAGSLASVLVDTSRLGALTADQTDRAWAVTQGAEVDLSGLTILELNNLYDRFNGVADGWLSVSSQPWARASADGQCHVSTAGGRIVDREQDRAGEIRNRIAEEIRQRTPADELERNMRLETLIQFELLCEISLKHNPELRAEIAQAWGA